MTKRLSLALLTTTLLTLANQAWASSGRLVVLDLTSHRGAKIDSLNRAYVFDADYRLPGASASLSSELKAHTDTTSTGYSNDVLLERIRTKGVQAPRRWRSKKGEALAVFTFCPEQYPVDLKLDETGRETQFGSDLGKLFKAVAGTKLLTGDETRVSMASWILEKTRATLTIHAAPSFEQEDLVGLFALGLKMGDEHITQPVTKLGTAQTTLTTGPTEHWYLSASVPLTKIQEAHFVDSTGAFEPRDKPKEVLIGANFMVGDVLSDDYGGLLGGFAPGVVVEASSKPFRSFGVTASYRIRSQKVLGIQLDVITPFWGLIRSTTDVKDATGAVEHSVYIGVWGISLNLDKATSWL
jgi:hypothetical protein